MVELVRAGRSPEGLAKEFEPTAQSIRTWVKQADAEKDHPVHVHLNHFQVVSRDFGAAGPYDAGWKDTISMQPRQAADIAVRFDDYAGRFMVHCHNLEHEDMGMMADFTTTA